MGLGFYSPRTMAAMTTPSKLSPSQNRPTLATTLAAFLAALAGWGVDSLPASIPGEVIGTGYALVLLVIGLVVGQAVQWLGRNAPWAANTHAAAVAYALTLDPNAHRAELEQLLTRLGVGSIEEARRLVGLDS